MIFSVLTSLFLSKSRFATSPPWSKRCNGFEEKIFSQLLTLFFLQTWNFGKTLSISQQQEFSLHQSPIIFWLQILTNTLVVNLNLLHSLLGNIQRRNQQSTRAVWGSFHDRSRKRQNATERAELPKTSGNNGMQRTWESRKMWASDSVERLRNGKSWARFYQRWWNACSQYFRYDFSKEKF